jgi:hypothetical protein
MRKARLGLPGGQRDWETSETILLPPALSKRMTQMDHNEAVQQQAAVKYVLGELPTVQRDAYEEHYFDCAACAIDVKAFATFADTARDVVRQEEASRLAKDAVPAHGGWFAWFRPIVAVPAFAALLLLAGYQNLVSIPHWKEAAAQPVRASAQVATPHVLSVFSLLSANIRGSGHPVFHATPGESFALKVDITDPDPSASSSYLLRLVDSSGAAHLLGSVTREESRNTVFVQVPASFPAGNAQLIVLGMPQPGANAQATREITSIPFVVAFGPDIEHHP